MRSVGLIVLIRHWFGSRVANRYTVGIKAANLEILRKVANSAIETGVVKM